MIEIRSLLNAALGPATNEAASSCRPHATSTNALRPHNSPGFEAQCQFDMLLAERAGTQTDALLASRGTDFGQLTEDSERPCSDAAQLLQALLARRAFVANQRTAGAQPNMTKLVALGGVNALLAPWASCSDVNGAALSGWVAADLSLWLGDYALSSVEARDAAARWRADGNLIAEAHATLLMGDALAQRGPLWLRELDAPSAQIEQSPRKAMSATTHEQECAAAQHAYYRADELFRQGGDAEAAAQARLRVALLDDAPDRSKLRQRQERAPLTGDVLSWFARCSPLTVLVASSLAPPGMLPNDGPAQTPDTTTVRDAAQRSYSIVADLADVQRQRAERAILAKDRVTLERCLEVAESIDSVIGANFGACATWLLRATAAYGGLLTDDPAEYIHQASHHLACASAHAASQPYCELVTRRLAFLNERLTRARAGK